MLLSVVCTGLHFDGRAGIHKVQLLDHILCLPDYESFNNKYALYVLAWGEGG